MANSNSENQIFPECKKSLEESQETVSLKSTGEYCYYKVGKQTQKEDSYNISVDLLTTY